MIHKNLEGKCFGTVDFDNLLNEDSFGSPILQHLGKCYIYVYKNEGPIAHFHLKGSKSSNFEICIRLDCSNYFTHNGYAGSLNSKQAKQLDEYLSLIHDKECRWKEMVDFWNLGNNEFQIDNKIKPDYSKLRNYKMD